MMLNDLLREEKKTILKRWFDLILETYPADTAVLMGKGKNQFANPVGYTVSREIEPLFEGLLDDRDDENFSAPLDSILKIRAVQNFAPSKAAGFIFLLKKAIAKTLKNEDLKGSILEEWLKFQSRIDDLALLAFDVYMGCREKICEVRINRALAEKEMAFRMMERLTHSKEKHQG